MSLNHLFILIKKTENGMQIAQVHSVEQKSIGVRPAQALMCNTVAIIIRVILLSPYLCIHGVSLSSIHYNQSHHIYINRRQQYICLI